MLRARLIGDVAAAAESTNRFDVDVRVSGHDPGTTVRARGYTMSQSNDSGTTTLRASQTGFVPAGDLVVEYALPRRDVALRAFAYVPPTAPATAPPAAATRSATQSPESAALAAAREADGSAPGFALLAIRPGLPPWRDLRPRDYAFVVDVSHSMRGERMARATALLSAVVGCAGRTDFQQGDAHQLFRSVREQLFSLPDECIVYPGHDYEGRTSSTIGEERRHNPRIGGSAREEDFVGYMTNLGLPHPKQMAVAVPANLRGGEPEDGQPPPTPDWAPVVMTYAGLPEITADWVAHHRADVHVLDVRTAAEVSGELGHLEGAQLIPLDELRARTSEVPTDKPVVVVCQTGRRSALGTLILGKAGIARVANLAGGMVTWRDAGLPS